MPCRRACRYQALPQHQLNTLLTQRHQALHQTHHQPVQAFPRATTLVCQEMRGETEWQQYGPTGPAHLTGIGRDSGANLYPIPFTIPRTTHCDSLSRREHDFLTHHHDDSYTRHPKRLLGKKHKNTACRIIPPFLVTGDTPSYIGRQIWNTSTRLD